MHLVEQRNINVLKKTKAMTPNHETIKPMYNKHYVLKYKNIFICGLNFIKTLYLSSITRCLADDKKKFHEVFQNITLIFFIYPSDIRYQYKNSLRFRKSLPQIKNEIYYKETSDYTM